MTIGRGVARDATVGTNLLVALLLRYPAIGSAYMDTNGRHLRLTFLVTDRGPEQAAIWQRVLLEMLDAFFEIEGIQPTRCEVQYEAHAGLGLIHINRDLESIMQGEITLMVGSLEEQLGTDLRCEAPELSLMQDEVVMQEEWIGHLFENIRTGDESQSLLAIREGTRVLVYNANKS